MSEQQRQGEQATITRHSAVGYGFSRGVREFKVHDPEPHAQYSVSVSIEYKMPRKRTRQWMRAVPEDISFITIEVDGQTVYDSRSDVPCDMDEYQAVADRLGQPRVVHHDI